MTSDDFDELSPSMSNSRLSSAGVSMASCSILHHNRIFLLAANNFEAVGAYVFLYAFDLLKSWKRYGRVHENLRIFDKKIHVNLKVKIREFFA